MPSFPVAQWVSEACGRGSVQRGWGALVGRGNSVRTLNNFHRGGVPGVGRREQEHPFTGCSLRCLLQMVCVLNVVVQHVMFTILFFTVKLPNDRYYFQNFSAATLVGSAWEQ